MTDIKKIGFLYFQKNIKWKVSMIGLFGSLEMTAEAEANPYIFFYNAQT